MRVLVRNEKGTALIVALLFLMVLSVLVAALHKSSIFEIFFSNRYQQSQMAFYSAEEGAKRALIWLNNLGMAPENSFNMPTWFSNSTNTEPWSDYSNSSTSGFRYRFYVQHLKDAPSTYAGGESAKIGTSSSAGNKVHFYRITSEGSNSSGSVIKQVQIVVTANY